MGLRDEARKAITTVGKSAARRVVTRASAVTRWAGSDDDDLGPGLGEVDEILEKAAREAVKAGNDGSHAPAGDPKAAHFDPFDLVAAMGYREKPSSVTFGTLEAVGSTVPVIADIVRARTSQVCRFCEVPESRYAPGLAVRPRDKRSRMTKAVQKRCDDLQEVMLNTGYRTTEDDPGVPLRAFASMFLRDSLIMDQGCFETVPDKRGRPSYFMVVDGATIRLLDPSVRSPGDPFAVQMIDGSMITDFTTDELAFCVRNPRAGIRAYGYGQSEIETAVREITGFLWSIEYNRKYFSQGSSTKGILNFKGTIPDKHLKAFRRQWYAMVAGINNAWRTPITNAEELQWINLQLSNKDMEFSHYMDFLIKIFCARYQIAPEEVNFSYGNTNQAQAMSSSPFEEKLKASRDLGLRPLVHWFFGCLNRGFLWRLDPDFEIVPVNLDEKGPEAEADLLTKQLKGFITVDEARERLDLDPMPDDQGKCILDPTWLQYAQGKEAAAGMDDEGGMGEDGDGGGEDEEPQGEPLDFDVYGEDGTMYGGPDGGDDKQIAKSESGGVSSDRPVIHYEIEI